MNILRHSLQSSSKFILVCCILNFPLLIYAKSNKSFERFRIYWVFSRAVYNHCFYSPTVVGRTVSSIVIIEFSGVLYSWLTNDKNFDFWRSYSFKYFIFYRWVTSLLIIITKRSLGSYVTINSSILSWLSTFKKHLIVTCDGHPWRFNLNISSSIDTVDILSSTITWSNCFTVETSIILTMFIDLAILFMCCSLLFFESRLLSMISSESESDT